jgi:hypothetical protein
VKARKFREKIDLKDLKPHTPFSAMLQWYHV